MKSIRFTTSIGGWVFHSDAYLMLRVKFSEDSGILKGKRGQGTNVTFVLVRFVLGITVVCGVGSDVPSTGRSSFKVRLPRE